MRPSGNMIVGVTATAAAAATHRYSAAWSTERRKNGNSATNWQSIVIITYADHQAGGAGGRRGERSSRHETCRQQERRAQSSWQ